MGLHRRCLWLAAERTRPFYTRHHSGTPSSYRFGLPLSCIGPIHNVGDNALSNYVPTQHPVVIVVAHANARMLIHKCHNLPHVMAGTQRCSKLPIRGGLNCERGNGRTTWSNCSREPCTLYSLFSLTDQSLTARLTCSFDSKMPQL